jgi:hypothetical protein
VLCCRLAGLRGSDGQEWPSLAAAINMQQPARDGPVMGAAAPTGASSCRADENSESDANRGKRFDYKFVPMALN